MISLNQKLSNFSNEIAKITGCNIYHYFRPVMNAPYILWAETGESNSLEADNGKREQAISIDVDYYTKTEFDSVIDAIQNLFVTNGFAFELSSVAFEDDTNLIHYNWVVTI